MVRRSAAVDRRGPVYFHSRQWYNLFNSFYFILSYVFVLTNYFLKSTFKVRSEGPANPILEIKLRANAIKEIMWSDFYPALERPYISTPNEAIYHEIDGASND